MNQILQTEKAKAKQTDIKNVIVFFAIAIIIFGILLLGQGIYSVVFKNEDNTEISDNIDTAKPQVNIEKVPDSDNIKIEVAHINPISQIVYRWNEEEENVIDAENKTQISELIELPVGSNTLYLKVTDINGEFVEFEKEYVLEGNGKPVISLTVTGDNKIKIVAKDEQALKDMVFSWNNGDETRVEANMDNLQQIEREVEIPLGQNTLKVTATNVEDIQSTKELEVKGIKKPTVTVEREGDYLIITATDENAMKIVTYTLNGKTYQLNFGEQKVIKYKQLLEEGENLLILTAENKDGGITEYKGKCIK